LHGPEIDIRKKEVTAVWALALLFAWTAGAWGAPLRVVAASTDLKSLVEAVGGDQVHVESLTSPLQDPHAVEVKPGQLARMKSADLLVRVGLDHEPWLQRALLSLKEPRFERGSPNYLDASKGIELLQAETPRLRTDQAAHLHGFGNTHYWLDPENGGPISAAILAALTRLVPAGQSDFATNRGRFLDRLEKRLKVWSGKMAPYAGTKVVAVHESWPYFARRFGFTIVAVTEPTPGVPPAPAYLAELIQHMRAAGIKLLLAEPYSNSSVVKQVAERSGARAVTLIPSVGGDAEASDYLSLFDLNVKRFTEAAAR
jgi:ABC-type Zn uptake system ZnuABC Zn-binding protein ZnuA